MVNDRGIPTVDVLTDFGDNNILYPAGTPNGHLT